MQWFALLYGKIVFDLTLFKHTWVGWGHEKSKQKYTLRFLVRSKFERSIGSGDARLHELVPPGRAADPSGVVPGSGSDLWGKKLDLDPTVKKKKSLWKTNKTFFTFCPKKCV